MRKETKRFKKQARLLAEKLPLIRKVEVIGVRVLGAELIKNGIVEDGSKNPIDENRWYSTKESRLVYVNHFKELIKAFDKFGEAGVASYLLAVKDHKEQEELRKAAELEKMKNLNGELPEGSLITTHIEGL